MRREAAGLGGEMEGPWPRQYLAGALLEAVTAHFAFLEAEHGFRVAEATTGPLGGPSVPITSTPSQLVCSGWTVFRWTTAAVVFSFTLAPSRHEVDLTFRRAGDDWRRALTLYDVLAYVDPTLAASYEATYYVHEYETWPEIVPRIAAGVRLHGAPWLRGEPWAYAAVQAFRDARNALSTAKAYGHVTAEQYHALHAALTGHQHAALLSVLAAIPPRGLLRQHSRWLVQVRRYAESRVTAG